MSQFLSVEYSKGHKDGFDGKQDIDGCHHISYWRGVEAGKDDRRKLDAQKAAK